MTDYRTGSSAFDVWLEITNKKIDKYACRIRQVI